MQQNNLDLLVYVWLVYLFMLISTIHWSLIVYEYSALQWIPVQQIMFKHNKGVIKAKPN